MVSLLHREYVDDHIAKIHQNPAAGPLSFDVFYKCLILRQTVLHLVAERRNLTVRHAGSDDEVIRKGSLLRYVQYDYVLRFFGIQRRRCR